MSYRITEAERKFVAVIDETEMFLEPCLPDLGSVNLVLTDRDKLNLTVPIPFYKFAYDFKYNNFNESIIYIRSKFTGKIVDIMVDIGWDFELKGIFTEIEKEQYLNSIQLTRLNDHKTFIIPVNKIENLSTNNFTVNGPTEFNGDVTFHENVLIEKNITVSGKADFLDELTVKSLKVMSGLVVYDDESEFHGDIIVYGRTILQDKVFIQNEVNITGGNLILNNSKLIGEKAYFSEDLSVGNRFSVRGKSHFLDDVELEKNLYVSGDLNVSGISNFYDDVELSNNLYVSGNSNISGDLTVSGNSYFYDNVELSKNLYVSGDLSVSGTSNFYDDVTIDKNLYVSGDSNISGNLSVSGASNFYDDVTIDKNLYVSGSLEVSGITNLWDEVHVHNQIPGHNTGDPLTIDEIKSLPDTIVVSIEMLKQVISDYETQITNLRDEILNPKSPTGIVYIDSRADVNGKQTITTVKEVPTPAV
jgi:cytoskeletal protein CcmA (bactofilin family)